MGLTIHYTIKPASGWDWRTILERLNAARDYASGLPVAEVDSQIRMLVGDATRFDRHHIKHERTPEQESEDWFKIQAKRWVRNPWHPGSSMHQPPDQVAGFTVHVADGCEPMNIGCCDFPEHVWPRMVPAVMRVPGRHPEPPTLPAWSQLFGKKASSGNGESRQIIVRFMKKYGLRKLARPPSSGQYSTSHRPRWREGVRSYDAEGGYVMARAGFVEGPYRSHRKGSGEPRAVVVLYSACSGLLGTGEDLWFSRSGTYDECKKVFASRAFKRDLWDLIEGREHATPPERSWGSFCKTQYASSPDCGGAPNFVVAHLSVLTILEWMQSQGWQVRVHDESHFWEHRDVSQLVKCVGEWNGMMASAFGSMKAVLGDQLKGEIEKFPNYHDLAKQPITDPLIAKGVDAMRHALFAAKGMMEKKEPQ